MYLSFGGQPDNKLELATSALASLRKHDRHAQLHCNLKSESAHISPVITPFSNSTLIS
jgi:hypothetical protein